MKITLVSLYPDIFAPGVRSLCASLKSNGHEATIVFLRNEFNRRYKDNALEEFCAILKNSDLIGVSLMTNFFDNAIQVTRKIKERTKAPIIWGGIHPTVRPQECLDYADMVCIGEGEMSLVELAGKMENGREFHDVEGIWLKRSSHVIRNKLRPIMQDLDSIPYPDCDYESQYALNDDGHISRLNEGLLKRYMCTNTYKLAGTYMTLPTRGCPFGCSYCCNNTLNKMFPTHNVVRKRSVDNVIKELKEAKARMPYVGCIWFEDDSFFDYTLEEIKSFCVKYKESIGLALEIHGISPLTIDREKLSYLVDAGLQVIRMGIQTASESIKKLYKRNYSHHVIKEAVFTINSFKDKLKMIFYDIIVDNPWESDDQLVETLMFLSGLPPPYYLNLFSLTFYPGTELYTAARRDGIIKDDLNDVYRKYYHTFRKTYLNMLLVLQGEYAKRGMRIPSAAMAILTDRFVRRSGLAWILLAPVKLPIMISRFFYLMREGFNAARAKDISRIVRHVIRKTR